MTLCGIRDILASLWYNLAVMKTSPKSVNHPSGCDAARVRPVARPNLGPGLRHRRFQRMEVEHRLGIAGRAVVFLVEGAWATCGPPPPKPIGHARQGMGQVGCGPRPALPYAQPNTPGDRALRWYSHTVECGGSICAHYRPDGVTIALCIALGAALSAVLGWPIMALSAAAAAVVQLGVIIGRGTGRPSRRSKPRSKSAWYGWRHTFCSRRDRDLGDDRDIGAGRRRLYRCLRRGPHTHRRRKRATIWNAAQFAVATLLVLMRQPVAALAVFFIVLPQLLLEPAMRRATTGATGVWFVRSTQHG